MNSLLSTWIFAQNKSWSRDMGWEITKVPNMWIYCVLGAATKITFSIKINKSSDLNK